MIEEEGIVIETHGDLAKVAIMTKSACEKCASAGVCHPDGEDSYMEASNPLNARTGQKVKVVVAPQMYLKASIILYGIPTAALLGGAIAGKNIALRYGMGANADLWAFLAGIACLFLSFVLIKRYNAKVEATKEYKPVIVEIIG